MIIPDKRFATLLIISNLLSLILINPVMAEPELLRTLTVTGNGMEKVATTLAEVRLGVEIQGKTATEVQQEIAKRTSAIVDLLRSQDVDQLQTTGVRLNPNYDRSNQGNGARILVGYIGTNTVSFRIPIEQVGTLLDQTVAAGASRVDGVSFTATPEAIFTAKKAALRQASINAQDRADVVLDALGLTSREIVNIEVDQAQVRQPRSIAGRRFSAAQSEESTIVVGGEQTVGASVTLQISY